MCDFSQVLFCADLSTVDKNLSVDATLASLDHWNKQLIRMNSLAKSLFSYHRCRQQVRTNLYPRIKEKQDGNISSRRLSRAQKAQRFQIMVKPFLLKTHIKLSKQPRVPLALRKLFKARI